MPLCCVQCKRACTLCQHRLTQALLLLLKGVSVAAGGLGRHSDVLGQVELGGNGVALVAPCNNRGSTLASRRSRSILRAQQHGVVAGLQPRGIGRWQQVRGLQAASHWRVLALQPAPLACHVADARTAVHSVPLSRTHVRRQVWLEQ